MFKHLWRIPLALLLARSCGGVGGDRIPHTDRTAGLVRELLVKLDSADAFSARREEEIKAAKSLLPGDADIDRFSQYFRIAELYSKYRLDSAFVWLDKAIGLARETSRDSLCYIAEFAMADILSASGFAVEAREVLELIPRSAMSGALLTSYYYSWAEHYHYLYNSPYEPVEHKVKYRAKYAVYRDSLLSTLDTTNAVYLRNVERIYARAGNFAEARRYNAIRLSSIRDCRAYATCLYDRFMIAYYYERKLTGEAVDDLLECAILEVEESNYDIASLLRVEALLIENNEISAAKKVSDYYYSSLRKFGSRQRLTEGGAQAIRINDRNSRFLQKKNNEFKAALVVISFLSLILLLELLIINSSRVKITRMKDDLERSGKITKGYIGVLFKLYSSYIKRLDLFRTRIHSNLRRGRIEQALELTSPSGDISSDERKELFHNFDSAFVDIFPTFIDTVNSCLRPEMRIVPKKTEILNNELRILALVKLGICGSAEIADLLHCSVKTVYNLRSVFKYSLSIPEEDFNRIISEL